MLWDLIGKLDAPISAEFDFPRLFLVPYRAVEIHMAGVTVTTNATNIHLNYYVAGTEITAGYRWTADLIAASGSTGETASNSDSKIVLNTTGSPVGNASTKAFSGNVSITFPSSSALYKKCNFQTSYTIATATMASIAGAGIMDNAGAIDGIKISGDSDLTAGRVRLIGIK